MTLGEIGGMTMSALQMAQRSVVGLGLMLGLTLLATPVCHAGGTITVNTAATTIDFAATGNSVTTLVRPSWDMIVQASTGQPSPSAGVWVPGGGTPNAAQLVSDLGMRGDNKISLPEAIIIANATQYLGTETGTTTIVFDTAAMGTDTVTLEAPDNWWYGPNGLPPIYSNVVIDGGTNGVTIQRDGTAGTPNFRLLYVAGKFHDLVGGKASTLRPYVAGLLTLRNLTLRNGLAKGGDSRKAGGGAGLGGAIYNQGWLTLDHVLLAGNKALAGKSDDSVIPYTDIFGGGGMGADALVNSGGGMRPGSDPTQKSGGGFLSQLPRAEGGDSTSVSGVAGAGGVSFFGGNGHSGLNSGTTTCSTFAGGGGFISDASGTGAVRGDGGGYSANCRGGGGAFGGGGAANFNVTDGGVGGGGGSGADGGFGGGGGVNALGGFGGGSGRYRAAWGFGGGAGGTCSGSVCTPGGGGAGLGGAVFNHAGSLTIQNGSTISNNTAQGGSGYGGGAGYGGGVFNLDGSVVIDASTISANTVTGGGAATGGQVGNAAGGALYNRFQSEDVGVMDLRAYRGVAYSPSLTQVTLRNATLGGSVGGVDCFTDGGTRQESGADEAYVGSMHFQGSNSIGADAVGINACGNFNHRGVRFTFSLTDDSAGDFAAQGWLAANSSFQQNLQAAAALWANEFDIDGVDLRVSVVADNTVARMSGGSFSGWNLGPSGSNTLLEPSPLSKMRTSASPTLPYDILILVNTAFVMNNYWIDPTPANRNDNAIPVGMTDLVSIVSHELEHGLGMEGWRSLANDGTFSTFPLGYVNPFDTLTSYDTTNGPFFTGTGAKAAFSGNPVPLTYWLRGTPNVGSDFYHFGATCLRRDDTTLDRRLRFALMSDCPVPTNGTYNMITPLDRAVLRDLGYPLKIFQSDLELQNSEFYSGP